MDKKILEEEFKNFLDEEKKNGYGLNFGIYFTPRN